MNKEIKIDLGKITNAINRKWGIVVCSAALCLALASIFAELNVKEEYSASTTVFSMSYASLSESLSGSSALSAYVNLIGSRKVAESALTYLSGEYELDTKEIRDMISTDTLADYGSNSSERITITATAKSADEAVAVANAVANAFVYEMQSMTGSNMVQVLDSAQNAEVSNGLAKMIIRVLGLLFGVMIPVIIIFFREVFSDEVYRIEDATCGGRLEVLAIIPNFDNK